MAMISCPNCGEKVSDTAKKCIFCGKPLTQTDAGTPAPEETTAAPAPKKTTRKTTKKVTPVTEETVAEPTVETQPEPTRATRTTAKKPAAFCSSCGSPISASALFCPNCGAKQVSGDAPVAEEVAAPAVEVAPVEEAPVKKANPFLQSIWALLASFFSLFLFFIPVQMTKSAVGAINGFDIMFFSKIATWWGSSAGIACFGAWVTFIVSAGCTVFAVLRLVASIKGNTDSFPYKAGEKIAVICGLVASCLYCMIGFISLFICDISWWPFTWAFLGPIFHGLILVASSLRQRYEKMSDEEKETTLLGRPWLIAGFSMAALGFTVFFSIVIIGLLTYGKVYLFQGYAFTQVLAALSISLMVAGGLILLVALIASLCFKFGPMPKKTFMKVGIIVLLVCSLGFCIWGAVDQAESRRYTSSSGGSGGGSGGGSYFSFANVFSDCNCSYIWADWGTSYLTVDTNPYDYDEDDSRSTTYLTSATNAIKRIHTYLGIPSSVYNRMLSTRYIDGMQYYYGSKVTVSWRYHPNWGLEVRYSK